MHSFSLLHKKCTIKLYFVFIYGSIYNIYPWHVTSLNSLLFCYCINIVQNIICSIISYLGSIHKWRRTNLDIFWWQVEESIILYVRPAIQSPTSSNFWATSTKVGRFGPNIIFMTGLSVFYLVLEIFRGLWVGLGSGTQIKYFIILKLALLSNLAFWIWLSGQYFSVMVKY